MQLEKVYQAIMNGRAILITGSGAHSDVLTPDGKPFPSGIELAKTIYASCGIMNPENIWDIQDAADTFLEKKKQNYRDFQHHIVQNHKNFLIIPLVDFE